MGKKSTAMKLLNRFRQEKSKPPTLKEIDELLIKGSKIRERTEEIYASEVKISNRSMKIVLH